MNQSLMTEFKEDLKDFREMTEKFYAKERMHLQISR